MADQGFFIVLEGSDGSGKGTQFRLLTERLKAVGYDVEVVDFPRYEHESSYFVRRYLNGDYGPAGQISPYNASLFYALDRYEAAKDIKKALSEGKIVLANRYVGSNMAHQGSKFEDPIEQRSFFVWADSLEYQLLNIPRPNLNIYLRVPAEISYELIAKKNKRDYTDKSRDEHEADMGHLKRAVATYELLCKLFPTDFVAIDCVEKDELLGIPEINNRIWDLVKPMLPNNPAHNAKRVTLNLNETSSTKSKAVAADAKQDYEGGRISLGLIAQLESSFPGAIKYNLDWSANNYQHLGGEELPKKTKDRYDKLVGELIELNKKVAAKDSSLAKLTTPMLATTKVSFQLSNEHLKEVVERLREIGSAEASKVADLLSSSLTGSKPELDQGEVARSAKPEALRAILAKIAEENLPNNLSSEVEAIRLTHASPRNEFSVLVDAIYPYSNLPRDQIEDNLQKWNYQQKYQTLRSAVTANNASEGVQTYYKFDITANRLLTSQLLNSGVVTEFKAQPATPRYGYEVPKEAENLGIEEEFISCFDKSLELFSLLQSAGREDLASDAVLVGHKQRFQVLIRLEGLKKLSNSTGELKALFDQMAEKVGEAHPVIGSSLTEEPQTPEAEKEPKPAPKKSARRRNRRGGRSKKS